jgi:D-galactarolactone cycloisomerase
MRITAVKTYILRVPIKEKTFLSSQCLFPERNSLLVKIETDTGLTGWGEGGQYGPPEPVLACIEHVLTPLIIGEDPLKPVVVSENLYSMTRDFGQRGPYIEAISAIDIALWDIKGKYYKAPVCELLGGSYQESITAYATGGYYIYKDFKEGITDLEALAEEAAGFLKKGFKVVKIKIGLLKIEEDIKRVEKIRKVVGDDFKLLIDCNHAYNFTSARKVTKYLEKFNVEFLEEPVPPEDLDGYSRLRLETSIPIAGGECFYTAYDFRRALEKDCLDVMQPDICVSGGFTEFIKIRSMAVTWNTRIIPHVWGSGIAIAAAIQAIATLQPVPYTFSPLPYQNLSVIEYDQSPNPLRDELLRQPFQLVDGKVIVPKKPGLGVELDEDVLERYSVL